MYADPEKVNSGCYLISAANPIRSRYCRNVPPGIAVGRDSRYDVLQCSKRVGRAKAR